MFSISTGINLSGAPKLLSKFVGVEAAISKQDTTTTKQAAKYASGTILDQQVLLVTFQLTELARLHTLYQAHAPISFQPEVRDSTLLFVSALATIKNLGWNF